MSGELLDGEQLKAMFDSTEEEDDDPAARVIPTGLRVHHPHFGTFESKPSRSAYLPEGIMSQGEWVTVRSPLRPPNDEGPKDFLFPYDSGVIFEFVIDPETRKAIEQRAEEIMQRIRDRDKEEGDGADTLH